MIPKRPSRLFLLLSIPSLSLLLLGLPVEAQTASALLREGDPLPGFSDVNSIIQPAVNHVGGYSLLINTNESGSTVSHIWGNSLGGPGSVLITEGVFGDYEQTSFESFHGFSDAGDPGYSAVANEFPSGATGLDGVWVDTTPVLVEGELIPSLSGAYSTFNSRPGISADGQPYWVGGFGSVPGGSTENRALFLGVGATPVLKGGDPIGGIPETVIPGSGGIDFNYRFSRFATNYVMECLINTGSSATDGIVVRNGNLVVVAGGCMCEAEPIPAAVGGLPGEFWSAFDYFGINEAGLFMVTGDTSADFNVDEFVFLEDQIVLREGDALLTPQGRFTVSGAIESASMNENADWAVTWDLNDLLAVNREALLLNGELLLLEGNAVDLDGDGSVEQNSILVDFTGIASLVVSDRDMDGFVSVYFTADVDTEGTSSTSDDVEALFRITVQLETVNQPPVAVCQDVTVEAGPTCEADADIDAGSFDPDGDPISLEQTPPGPYGLGATSVTLTVTDPLDAFDSCTATVNVVPEPLQLAVTDPALTWGPAVCDVGYDVVRGDLATLLQSDGDFSSATVECLADDVEETMVGYTGEPVGAGEGEWYLVRRIGTDGNGSYDSGAQSQQGPRDAGIAASGVDCP